MIIELIALHAALSVDANAQTRSQVQLPQTRAEQVVSQTRSERLLEMRKKPDNADRKALLEARAELDAAHQAGRINNATYAEANFRNAIALMLLEDSFKDLEAEDKLGNFEIQDLMSRFNQAEQTASSVTKKQDDTASAIIGKIG